MKPAKSVEPAVKLTVELNRNKNYNYTARRTNMYHKQMSSMQLIEQ